jgi:predicted transcriptional regulator
MPKQWSEVYPHGTKEGDEEQALFMVLSRHQKWAWRSVSALSKEAGLTKERVEQILYKYWKLGMVIQNPASEDQWGYWERVYEKEPSLIPKEVKSIIDLDHEERLKKAGICL